MAKLMAFTDNTGYAYPATAWVPLFQATDLTKPTPGGSVVFLGYKTQQQAAAKLAHVLTGGAQGQPVPASWTKSYVLTGAQVIQFALAQPPGATMLDAIAAISYMLAAAVLDTDPRTGPVDGAQPYAPRPGTTDPAAVGFFAG